MDAKSGAFNFEDPDFFTNVKNAIENELSIMQKIVNNISQLRVETAYLESDLIMSIDATTWGDISELIGLGSRMDACLKDDMA